MNSLGSDTTLTRRQVIKSIAATAAVAGLGSTPVGAVKGGNPDKTPLLDAPRVENRVVRVAGLVIEKRDFDCEANMRELEELVPRAADKGAKIVVTPEGFLEGYIIQTPGLTPERYSEVAQQIPGSAYYERIRQLALKNKVYLAAGMAEKDGDIFYNTCALISPDGELVGKYHKSHTLSDESLNTLGNEFPVFETEIGRIGIMICYDRQPPETARMLALHGADIILNPAAGSYGETNTMIVRMRAYENGIPIVFAHFAEALIINRSGSITNRYEAGGDRAVVADLEIGRGKSTIDFRRPELYVDLCDKSIKPGRV